MVGLRSADHSIALAPLHAQCVLLEPTCSAIYIYMHGMHVLGRSAWGTDVLCTRCRVCMLQSMLTTAQHRSAHTHTHNTHHNTTQRTTQHVQRNRTEQNRTEQNTTTIRTTQRGVRYCCPYVIIRNSGHAILKNILEDRVSGSPDERISEFG